MLLLSTAGGIVVGMLNGFTIPRFWKFPGYRVKPLFSKFAIPPLIGMIVMGSVTKNYIGNFVNTYNGNWSQFVINCVVGILFTKGGLVVNFRGKGWLMLFMMIVPQACEVSMIALVTYGVFRMPVELCYCMGYSVGNVASAVIIPGMLKDQDYGS